MNDYGWLWCILVSSSSVFSLFFHFVHFKRHSLHGSWPAPRLLSIDAVAFAGAGHAGGREPTESQDFLHLLRGSALAMHPCWTSGIQQNSEGCLEMKLPR